MAEKTSKPNELGDNLRPTDAAQYVGLSTSKLAKLRMEANRDKGPKFVKVCGCVIYRRADLDAWLESHIVETGEAA
jgi:predicted DNA-binding transcriptional regulator AlpA